MLLMEKFPRYLIAKIDVFHKSSVKNKLCYADIHRNLEDLLKLLNPNIKLNPNKSQKSYFDSPKMITRREKLLVRPWQLRRYNNHKKKVFNAVPIVDFGPPPQRRHVTVKLKKLQKERERQMKIEEDNFTLLQHLGSIMKQKRVDNYWETKPPTFLRRVGIYHRTRTPTPCEETTPLATPETYSTRKLKCLACTPHPEPPEIIPEERIPWEPPKQILTRRLSRSAIVPLNSDFDFPKIQKIRTEKTPKPVKDSNRKKLTSDQALELPILESEKNFSNLEAAEQKIIVRQGPVQIAVNFPTFAEVKLVRGKTERYLQRNYCECKSYCNKKKLPVKAKSGKMISDVSEE